MKNRLDTQALRKWFKHHKRELPWRDQPTPYEVWVSEVMLQQTQVAVVIPYFEKWMKLFPSIEALAQSPLDDVIKAWEGLGYYSRARNLHEGARYVVSQHQGQLPCDRVALSKIKGLGPYTVGAILSFAFRQKASAVDGNVLRVLSRYLHIEDDISKPKTISAIRDIAESLLPKEAPWEIAEALIELGATICQKQPRCQTCPLKHTCQGHIQGTAATLPFKSQKIQVQPLYRAVAIINHGDHVLVQRGEKGKIMGDLYEFPYFDTQESGITPEDLCTLLLRDYGLRATAVSTLPEVAQAFTRYRVKLRPVILHTHSAREVPPLQWIPSKILHALPFSSGHRRILTQLKET